MTRRTVRRAKKGSGWFGGPTRSESADIFNASNGIQISRSKSRDLPLYSKDNGKNWNYVPSKNEDKPGIDPPDVAKAYKEYMDNMAKEYEKWDQERIKNAPPPPTAEQQQRMEDERKKESARLAEMGRKFSQIYGNNWKRGGKTRKYKKRK